MPKLSRRAGAVGLALSAYDFWKRLSPRQKRMIVRQAKRYGPRLGAAALRSAKSLKKQ